MLSCGILEKGKKYFSFQNCIPYSAQGTLNPVKPTPTLTKNKVGYSRVFTPWKTCFSHQVMSKGRSKMELFS